MKIRFSAVLWAMGTLCFVPVLTQELLAQSSSSSSSKSSSGSKSGSNSSADEESKTTSIMDFTESRMENVTSLTEQMLEKPISDQESVFTTGNQVLSNAITSGSSTATGDSSSSLVTGSELGKMTFNSAKSINTGGASQIDSATSMYAPKLVISFAVAAPREKAVKLAKSLNLRMRMTPNLSRMNRVEIRMNDQVATLLGTVATSRDRSLMEQIILFEPGVIHVQNELQIDPTLAATDPLWAGVKGDATQLPSVEAVRAARELRRPRLVVELRESSQRAKQAAAHGLLTIPDEDDGLRDATRPVVDTVPSPSVNPSQPAAAAPKLTVPIEAPTTGSVKLPKPVLLNTPRTVSQ
ncbi:MAG: hypothetical protein PHE53_08655 [Thermoguttaceae bacterium]|nr:hypothetical protein [Thermoguttaceae bacterium]